MTTLSFRKSVTKKNFYNKSQNQLNKHSVCEYYVHMCINQSQSKNIRDSNAALNFKKVAANLVTIHGILHLLQHSRLYMSWNRQQNTRFTGKFRQHIRYLQSGAIKKHRKSIWSVTLSRSIKLLTAKIKLKDRGGDYRWIDVYVAGKVVVSIVCVMIV